MVALSRQMGAEEASPKTIEAYQGDLHHFVSFLTTLRCRDTVAHYTTDNVTQWLIEQTEKGIHPNTRNRRLAALARLGKFLETTGRIEKDPTRSIRRAKRPKRIVHYLLAEVVSRLIRAAGPTAVSVLGSDRKPHLHVVYRARNEAILRVFAQGGLRLEEVETLSLASIGPNGIIVLGKGNKERVISVQTSLAAALHAWLAERKGGRAPEDAFFTNHAGGRLSRRQISKIVKDAGKRVALQLVHPHLLRHTMATLMRLRGAELDAIRNRLGHESIATTEQYTHAIPFAQAAAAELIGDL